MSNWQNPRQEGFSERQAEQLISETSPQSWVEKRQPTVASIIYGYGLGTYGLGVYGIGEGTTVGIPLGSDVWQLPLDHAIISSKEYETWQAMVLEEDISLKLIAEWNERRVLVQQQTQSLDGWGGATLWGTSRWGGSTILIAIPADTWQQLLAGGFLGEAFSHETISERIYS